MSFLNFSSGIFGTPPKENNPAQSPLRSPFCTSPSQLHEMTCEPDGSFSNTTGLRWPNEPMRGRTVKEFEEQLTHLKKENFNLKLRIYFLEEKMGFNFTLDKDNIVKKNIELQVEIGNLQKEVKEKHELLCQAVKAMEVLEDEQKKYSQNKEEQIEKLNQEIEDLRNQMQDLHFSNHLTSPKSGSSRHESDSDRRFMLEFIPEIQTPKRLGDEGDLSFKDRRESHLANFVYDRSDILRQQIETLEKKCENKDQIIESLNKELASANERLIDFEEQVKEYEENLSAQHAKNSSLLSRIQEEQKTKEKLKMQLTATTQKLSIEKHELEHDLKESQREKKSLERANLMLDMRATTMESENRKQKEAIKELHLKLEVAINEAKKKQNIAVSSGCNRPGSPSNTDDRFISATHPTAANGAAQEGPLHAAITTQPVINGPPQSQIPLTPDGKNLLNMEKLLETVDNKNIHLEFTALKHDFNCQKQKIIKLKSEQLKACEIIKSMIDFRNKAKEEIAQLKKDKENLEKELENVVSKPLQTRISQLNISAIGSPPPNETFVMAEELTPQQFADDIEMVKQYKELTVELEKKIEVLEAILKEKSAQIERIRDQYNDVLDTLEEKEKKIIDLEFEVLASNQLADRTDPSLLEKGDCGSEKQSSFYRRELDEKNLEIERLTEELNKCTCNLQEIVNTELWAKNREIEKLHQKLENTSEIAKLKKELSSKDLQLKLLKEKISELGLDMKLPVDDTFELKDLSLSNTNVQHIKTLQGQLKMAKEEKLFFENRVKELETSQMIIEKLKRENEDIKIQLEKSERLRREINEVCSVMGNRLEELAIFLDSLLKQKSVLGFLGSAKNKRLREIISNSLDMSRSFTMSLMVNPEQSLAQLSNITALLNGSVFQELSATQDVADEDDTEEVETQFSIIPDHVSLTYESHLQKKSEVDTGSPGNSQEQVIRFLREEIFRLKKELELRDNEMNNRLNEDDVEESGVDPLSSSVAELEEGNKETLGSSLRQQRVHRQALSEGQSESEAWSEPDTTVSRARIGLCEPSKVRCQDSTEEDDYYEGLTPTKKRSLLIDLTNDVYHLQDEVAQKTKELTTNETMYKEKLEELSRNLQKAEEEKEQALIKLEKLEKVDWLGIYKHVFEETLPNKFFKETEDAKKELANSQVQLQLLKESLQKLEEELRKSKDCEKSMFDKWKNAEETLLQKQRIVEKCEADVKLAQENTRLIQEKYAREFVRKADVENKLLEAEKITKELEEIKNVLSSYEQTISSYKEKEREIQNSIKQYQDQIGILETKLQQTVMRCSQLDSDNKKIQEENESFQQEIEKVKSKEEEMRGQLNDLQENFNRINCKYKEQSATVQKQKNNLELKISELESCNAELHNRLIKVQTRKFSLGLNVTLPANIGSNKSSYGRQHFDHNTYSSEEIGEDFKSISFNNKIAVIQQAVAEADRAEANSSPDLGIESDQGRFSSLETNGNIKARPLRRTIELTECMSNMFDEQTNNVDDHCCQKLAAIAQENRELKQQLMRLTRTLEQTAAQLNRANQRKKEIEKNICSQISKTSQVLRKAKANLDSGSESDVFPK
ncbi:hypothetical protein ABEB36_009901 [Hypothenemus hampei]|uniref:Centrosomin N-terminal motif 1 domain-containing protein n=1 Tax=Hypothenemus hampei TaxID=57062 RepID=A0ABD1EHU9_HYPHA